MIFVLDLLLFSILMAIASDCLHETSHFIVCVVLGCKVIEIKIPFLKIYKDSHRWKLKVALKEYNHCSFKSSNPHKAFGIIISGLLMNLLIFITSTIFIVFYNAAWYFWVMGGYNLIVLIYNILPRTGGDGALLLNLLKEM